jgi:hypothetical protein
MRITQLILLLAVFIAVPAQGNEWVLVANTKAPVSSMSQDEVINIYLGRFCYFSNGDKAEPFDQPTDSKIKVGFYHQLVNKDLAQINAYWSRLVFTGRTRPPRVLANSEAAIQYVSHHPAALAYVEREKVDARVKIVFAIAP